MQVRFISTLITLAVLSNQVPSFAWPGLRQSQKSLRGQLLRPDSEVQRYKLIRPDKKDFVSSESREWNIDAEDSKHKEDGPELTRSKRSFEEFDEPEPHTEFAAIIVPIFLSFMQIFALLLLCTCTSCIFHCRVQNAMLKGKTKNIASLMMTSGCCFTTYMRLYARVISCWASVLSWIWFVYIVVAIAVMVPEYSQVRRDPTMSDLRLSMLVVAMVFFIVYVIIVFAESCYSVELNDIRNIKTVSDVVVRIHELRAVRPSITFRASCWHWDSVYDSDAIGSSRDERSTSAVVDEPFVFGNFTDDVSSDEPNVAEAGITEINIEQEIKMADDYSQQMLNSGFEDFKTRHQGRDRFVDFSIIYSSSDNDDERMISRPKDGDAPRWISPKCFWLSTAFGMTWPYRLVLHRSTTRVDYKIIKYITVQHGPVQSGHIEQAALSSPEVSIVIHPALQSLGDDAGRHGDGYDAVHQQSLTDAPPPYEDCVKEDCNKSSQEECK